MLVLISLGIAVAPVVLILIYIIRQDRARPEPVEMVLGVFVWGVVGIMPAAFIEELVNELTPAPAFSPLLAALFQAFVVAALCEEIIKFWVVMDSAYREPAFDEVMDGIVYTVVAGLGFACIENIFYAVDSGIMTALLRAFTAVPMHALAAGIMGYHLGKAKFASTRRRELGYKLLGLAWAVLLHGAYNFFVSITPVWGLLPGLAVFLVLLCAYSAFRKCVRLALAADRAAGRIERSES
jgi:RsiW-degrading membrane proteinase PrsW (M82 family)